MKQIIEKYEIDVEGLKVPVEITGGEGIIPLYRIRVIEFSPPTQALLDEIKRGLITEITISAGEILDPKVIEKLKARFKEKANALIKEKLPHIQDTIRNYLVLNLINDMVGLGKIELLLNDPNLEEIVINSAAEPIRIYHKKHKWLETNITIQTESQIQNFANIIARRVGRQITTLTPLLDAHLITGDRSNALLYPISNKGNTITIRKFARDPWTVTDFITTNTCTAEIFALIWLSIQYEMNVLISGGTASGKTSMLGVCMPFIPPNQRIISIEDTRELQLPHNLYWCPLTTRQANPEGKGEVSMLDLLVNSLRMRPDRLILGEIRRARDAEVLFEAMHTGHSVCATVHADSISETIARLVNPPINVPGNLLGAVHLNVVMFRDRRRGIRRLYQMGEFLASEEAGQVTVRPNILYRWKPSSDKIVPHGDSLRLFEQLSRHTGMSQSEIVKDIAEKEKILNWMVKNKIRSIEDVGKIMNDFYLDKETILKAVTKNLSPKKIKND